MEQFDKKLDWENVSKHQRLPFKMIDKYADQLDWKHMVRRKSLKFNSKVLTKFSHKLDEYFCWDIIGIQNIDFEFIQKFKHKINSWKEVIRKLVLPEYFLEEIKEQFDRWDWSQISSSQNISPEFIVRNMDNVEFPYLNQNKYVDSLQLEEMGVYVMAKLQGKRLSWY